MLSKNGDVDENIIDDLTNDLRMVGREIDGYDSQIIGSGSNSFSAAAEAATGATATAEVDDPKDAKDACRKI